MCSAEVAGCDVARRRAAGRRRRACGPAQRRAPSSLARVFKVAARALAESAAVAVTHAPAIGELCVLSARAKISARVRSDAQACRSAVGTAPRRPHVACRVGSVQGAREPVRSARVAWALRGATAQMRSSASSRFSGEYSALSAALAMSCSSSLSGGSRPAARSLARSRIAWRMVPTRWLEARASRS